MKHETRGESDSRRNGGSRPSVLPRDGAPRRRSRWLRLATGLALGLAAGEGIVRVVHRLREPADERASRLIHRASADRELIYELVPGSEGVRDGVPIRINDAGFRDDPFPEPTSTPALRVVLLGDSVAWGWGVEMPKAFPQRLERELNADRGSQAAPAIVLNMAVDGYATSQEVRLLETRVADFKPDLVIVAYVLNDPDVADGGLARHFTAPPSALLGLIQDGWRRAMEPQPAPFDGTNWDQEYHFFIHEEFKVDVEANFGRLGRWRRERSVPILVAVVPIMLFEPGVPYPWQYLHDQIGSLCAENGLEFLDLYTTFGGRSSQGLSFDEWHPNEAGHAIIAHALAERVRQIHEEAGNARSD